MQKEEIHIYDPASLVYLRSYPSKMAGEMGERLYRGAMTDAMKHGGKIGNTLVSLIKADIFPGTPPMREVKRKEINGIGVFTEGQLREKHDMFFMVYSYVSKIPKGSYIEEIHMLKELGLLGKPRYRDAISRHELKENKGRVDGVNYYGHIESIKKLKSEGVLQ